MDCGSARGNETLALDDIAGTGHTVRVGGSSVGDGYVVACNDDAGSAPLQGRIYGQGSAADGQGSICADGDSDNPFPLSGWACAASDRNGDGVTDVGCGGADDTTNSADPDNTAEPETCAGM